MRIGMVTATVFSTLFLFVPVSHAADGAGGAAPAPTPSRAPLGAPPSNDATVAYGFRANMSQEPNCQQLSQEADRVFMDGQMDMDKKVDALNQLKARAQQGKCLSQ